MTEQERHDAMHPGMVCRTCPRTLAHQAVIRGRVDRLGRPWWKWWLREGGSHGTTAS